MSNTPSRAATQAADHVIKLQQQGKPLAEALSHARHRFGVQQTAIRRELGRRDAS